MDVKQLAEVADDLFGKKAPLNSLHQEIADNFYPERAEFTLKRSLGTDFAAQLMSSFPVRTRRSLGDQFSSMLRPTAKPWFHVKRRHIERDEDTETKAWLQHFEDVQRRAMYDRGAKLARATKEGDHDFAAFGQCAISVEMNKDANGLLYRCWHLRDMAWQEDAEGNIGFVARRWKAQALTLKNTFKKVHTKVTEVAAKTPFEEFDVLHLIVPVEMYDKSARQGMERFSIFYDRTHDFVMEDTPIHGKHYIIPRWQTVSGSQYSYSPATVCALPDARLLQAMTFTLLEAGEKATSPPVIATKDAIRGDVSLYAGGVTWVDREYDERLGDALRPIAQDFRGFNFGVELNQDTRGLINAAFYLDKLSMPQRTAAMTAYEVGQRVQEYIRDALPIFEPLEYEYNAALCDETFGLLMRGGAFGSPAEWPKALRGAEIDFTFESPLHDAIEMQKGQKVQEVQALTAAAIALDPTAGYIPNAKQMLRDALLSVGVEPKWLNSEADVEQRTQDAQQKADQAQQLAAMESASSSAKNIGQSGLMPQPEPAQV
jgi:hypothetical protein